MNRILLFCVSVLLLNCSHPGAADSSQGIGPTGWEKPDLEGHWKFVTGRLVAHTPFLDQFPPMERIADERPLPQPPFDAPDLIFEGDSLYELYFPAFVSDSTRFSVDAGLMVARSRGHRERCPIELGRDTLFIYKPYWGDEYIQEAYVKTAFDDSTLAILEKTGVNYPALAGTWVLMRHQSFDDGSEPWELHFPYKIPDTLALSREDLIQVTHSDMTYWMPTGGKKRDYALSYDKFGYLQLTPGKWYHGEDPRIRFSQEPMED